LVAIFSATGCELGVAPLTAPDDPSVSGDHLVISGTISMNGELVPGAALDFVEPATENWLNVPQVVDSTTTDENGEFALPKLDSGTYTILTRSMDHRGNAFAILEDIPLLRGTSILTIKLQEAPPEEEVYTPPHMHQANGCWCASNGKWFDFVCCKGAWNTSCYWTWKGCDSW